MSYSVPTFVQKIIEKNDAGDHFPLYATCLGFELLTMIISKVNYHLPQFIAFPTAFSLLSFKVHIFSPFFNTWMSKLSLSTMNIVNFVLPKGGLNDSIVKRSKPGCHVICTHAQSDILTILLHVCYSCFFEWPFLVF